MKAMDGAPWRCRMCGWPNAGGGGKCISCGKSRPKRKTGPPPARLKPWRAVGLALDVGECTGWAIWREGRYVASGEVRIYTDAGVVQLGKVVEAARFEAALGKLPWMAVMERPWGGHMGLALPYSAGYWAHALRSAGLPRRAIREVYPATWRAKVLRKGLSRAKRDEVRKVEQQTASMVARRMVGADEAPAVLIGQWAMYAQELADSLPAKDRGE